MRSVLNLKIKYRESFRPFAPSVLREDVSQWFDIHTNHGFNSVGGKLRNGRDGTPLSVFHHGDSHT